MEFTSLPKNFSAVDEPLIYGLDFGERVDAVDVEIVDADAGRTLAVCRFADCDSARLDVAPHVRRLFSSRKLNTTATGIYEDPSGVAYIKLRALGQTSPACRFSPYVVDGAARLLTMMPLHRTLAAGERDELPIWSPMSSVVTLTAHGASLSEPMVQTFKVEGSDRIRILVVDTTWLPFGTEQVTVLFEPTEGSPREVDYRIVRRNADSCRVAWVASSGCIERYTFPARRSETLTAERSRVLGPEGWRTASLTAERVTELVSDYEPREMIESLEEIVSAPQTWMHIPMQGFAASDVLSSSTVRMFGGPPDRVTLTLRPARRAVEL